jgi:two-component system chemotaxis response regulator CheY
VDKTVVVVDDSRTIQMSLELCLKQEGFGVVAAGDGQQGLAAIQKLMDDGQLPALIISDVNMPVMDGLTFIREVKKIPKCKFVPILMLTTESQEDKKNEGKAAGASGWIVKPFQPDQLLSVVKRFVR